MLLRKSFLLSQFCIPLRMPSASAFFVLLNSHFKSSITLSLQRTARQIRQTIIIIEMQIKQILPEIPLTGCININKNIKIATTAVIATVAIIVTFFIVLDLSLVLVLTATFVQLSISFLYMASYSFPFASRLTRRHSGSNIFLVRSIRISTVSSRSSSIWSKFNFARTSANTSLYSFPFFDVF